MNRICAGLCIVTLVAACGLPRSGATTSSNLVSGSWIGRFAGTTAAGLRGEATLVPIPIPGRFRIQFELRSVNPTARLPWAVRSGRCGETGAVTLTTPAVPHIDARVDRTASLRAEVALELEPGAEYHVTLGAGVHSSDEIIACGALVFVP